MVNLKSGLKHFSSGNECSKITPHVLVVGTAHKIAGRYHRKTLFDSFSESTSLNIWLTFSTVRLVLFKSCEYYAKMDDRNKMRYQSDAMPSNTRLMHPENVASI